jgi:hypothetical protein
MDRPFRIERRNDRVIRVVYEVHAGWEGWMLHRSDAHHDHPDADHTLEKTHLDLALERKACIIDSGDCLCLMQGKFDGRREAGAKRPEHEGSNYLDLVNNTAVAFYRPYAHLFAVMGSGNHEDSIEGHHETHPIKRLCHDLGVNYGGYSGYVRIQFRRGKRRASLLMYYHHGYGGGGKTTRGVNQINHFLTNYPDVDIVQTGHTHDATNIPVSQEKVNQQDAVQRRLVWFIRPPGYKRTQKRADWENRSGHNVKPVGCAWSRFRWIDDQLHHEVHYDTRA